MKRKAEKFLKNWLARDRRKPLVIRGARQVGKSTLVRLFAERQGLRLIEVNLERHPGLEKDFATMDVKRVIREIDLGLGLGNALEENTILFIDEIQVAPKALQCLRYFYEELPELPVIAAGSLLEFALSDDSFSMPVGRVEYCWLGPMSFFEYLEAGENSNLIRYFHDHVLPESVSLNVHEQMISHLRDFFLTGGMPEAVLEFSNTANRSRVDDILNLILQTYRDDFSKYSKRVQFPLLQLIFDYMGRGAGQKIKYVTISRNHKPANLEKALTLLRMAQIITKICSSSANIPFNASVSEKHYKPYSLDVGLLSYLAGIRKLRKEQLMSIDPAIKGILAEQYACQHLIYLEGLSSRPEGFYWFREGANRNAEIDFVIKHDHFVIPVEIKAGTGGSLKSMQQFCFQKKCPLALRFDLNLPSLQRVKAGIRIKNMNKEVNFMLLSLPLYLIEKTHEYLEQAASTLDI
ncbi:MAG: ATP-binding protein [Desulfobulbaceae bacterium]|nr:ATP-binding protein [Desulfobulbaceae bacterium]